jgi:hypothetical protein
MNWYVGQQVYCLRFREGVIIDIEFASRYPIKVEFNFYHYRYTADGKLYLGDATPMLYPAKPEIIVPKWQPQPGQWCWFWDESTNGSHLAQFACITQHNNYETNLGSRWRNCAPFIGELPEHLKEGQP